LGRVSPERFIPIAESSGLIIALGKLIMKRVCADLSTWNDLRVSVNLSPVQLLDPNFLDDTDRIIRTANVAPNRIEFELTEGLVVDDPDRAAKILKSLRAQGHTISLDDFGTGFSSIGYLRRMSFDKLKVDKRFVSELGGSQKANELLKSLQLLSRSMNLTIVAEGVETETQYETLYELGYDYVQGYYSGRAMPFDDLFSIFPGRNMMERDEEMAQSA
jgi:EAL domain-containing protein (putative c-di-GMP-specific phosphodiesterase class I)